MFTLRVILPRCGRASMGIENTRYFGVAAPISIKNFLIHQPSRFSSQKIKVAETFALPAILKRNYADEARKAENDGQSQIQRVYYGSLTPRMKAVKVFSLTTSCAGMAAQPILLEQGMKLGGAGMAALFCGFAGFFTFVTPILLHFITKKYVTELHYNPATDEYTATTISLFLRRIETKFRPTDVKVPEVPGIFTSFYIDKKAFFVDPALFENTDHYVRIMGYDKPIDFKLDLQENSSPPTPAKATKGDKTL